MGQLSKGEALLIAFTAVLLLSTNATVASLASVHIDFFSFSLVSSALTAIVLCVRHGARLSAILRTLANPAFLPVIILKFVNDLGFYFAVMGGPSIKVTIIVYLYPIFNIIIGSLILGRRYLRPTLAQWVLIGLAFTAVSVLTPFAGFGGAMPVWIFVAAGVSAMASIYVVLLQWYVDREDSSSADEGIFLAAMFIGSTLIHVVAAFFWYPGGSAMALPDAIGTLISNPVVIASVIWCAFAVNIGSEALWLRASRDYRDVSLKSLFYFSPVLGALFLAFFGLDRIDIFSAFALSGVVLANLLIHQKNFDDISFFAFIFAVFLGGVLVRADLLLGTVADGRFLTELFLVAVTIIVGFLLAKALDAFSRTIEAYLRVTDRLCELAADHQKALPHIQDFMGELQRNPDIYRWRIQQVRPLVAGTGALVSTAWRDAEFHKRINAFLLCRFSIFSPAELLLVTVLALASAVLLLFTLDVDVNLRIFTIIAAAVFIYLPLQIYELAFFQSSPFVTRYLVRRRLLSASILSHRKGSGRFAADVLRPHGYLRRFLLTKFAFYLGVVLFSVTVSHLLIAMG